MREYYKDEPNIDILVNAEAATFRPTFLIDEQDEVPFVEEEYSQLRLSNTMFRLVGPCTRCMTTALDWRYNTRHIKNEPYSTIVRTRKNTKLGSTFGVYY